MKTPTVSAMLENVLSLIERETGAPLDDMARSRLELLLNDAVKKSVGLGNEDQFSAREVTVLLTARFYVDFRDASGDGATRYAESLPGKDEPDCHRTWRHNRQIHG
jgi:hypothetical protein